MSTFAHESIPPVEETAVHKTDVLDWSGLASVTSDLEFRDYFQIRPGAIPRITHRLAAKLSLTSLAAWALAHPIAAWAAPALDRTWLTALSLVAGVAWALWAEATHAAPPEGTIAPLVEPATLGRTFLPPLLWQAVTLTAHLDLLAAAYSYYLFVSLPLALLLFDGFATHAVYWLTASPAADYASKSFGRHIWARRLFGSPPEYAEQTIEPEIAADPAFSAAFEAANSYRWGLIWTVAATLVPPLLLLCTIGARKPSTLGLQLVLASFFGLLAAVILRIGADLRVVPRFCWMLYHWIYYGSRDRLPPWVFQSPCGGWFLRQVWLLLVVGLLAVPLTYLAAHSFAGMLEAAQTRGPVQHPVQQPVTADANLDHFHLWAMEAASSWLWIAPVVLVAMVVPPIQFCLLGLLLTGNLISAYQDSFETPAAEPPPVFSDEDEGHMPHADMGQAQ